MKIAEACEIVERKREATETERKLRAIRDELDDEIRESRKAHDEAMKTIASYLSGAIRRALKKAGVNASRYHIESGTYLRIRTEEDRRYGLSRNFGRATAIIVEHGSGDASHMRVECVVEIGSKIGPPTLATISGAAKRAAAAFVAGIE